LGLYDRGYYRDEYEQERRGFSLSSPRSMTIALIVVNVALYLLNALFFPKGSANPDWLSNLLSVSNLTLSHPWLWWQFLAYGFVHANPQHIFFNMLGLFFLGTAVEEVYGQKEYLRIYLAMIVTGSLVWTLNMLLVYRSAFFELPLTLMGASGAVTGIIMLFILRNPQTTLMLWPIPIPVKAWILGVILLVSNILGAVTMFGHIAWSVHLAGIAFAYIYFRRKWHLGDMFQSLLKKPKFLFRPKLRVHVPEEEHEPLDLKDEADLILEKIHKYGESSLTKEERRILENYSRRLRNRRHD
jgi:membrane associated rhomboid family serine protease